MKPKTKAFWMVGYVRRNRKRLENIYGCKSYKELKEVVRKRVEFSLLERIKREGYRLEGEITSQFLPSHTSCDGVKYSDMWRLDAIGVGG